jgi:hypothetical protein
VVLHQLAGLGAARDCRSALGDDRWELWLSRACRGLLTGLPEEDVPGLSRAKERTQLGQGLGIVGDGPGWSTRG